MGLLLTAILGLLYVLTAWVADLSLPARWGYITGYLGLLVATGPIGGWSYANYGVYVAIMLATLTPCRQARVAIVAWALSLVGLALITSAWTPAVVALLSVGIGLPTASGLEAGRVNSLRGRQDERMSALLLSAERDRIGRDLHDILGHSLTAISIKSGLAAKLVDHNPAAAKAQLAEIEVVARQALTDVRSTASAIREVQVGGEVASARSVLSAAGIVAKVAVSANALCPQVSELFGYVIREAVTNVVRHSEARTCTITVDALSVIITDDGHGYERETEPRVRPAAGGGAGLTGLADRVAGAGGRLSVRSVPGQGTRVRAVLTAPVGEGRDSAGRGPELALS